MAKIGDVPKSIIKRSACSIIDLLKKEARGESGHEDHPPINQTHE